MSMSTVTLLYLVASICFIQALKGLSHPTTSIRGNLFGMVGMAIAALTTAALIVEISGGKAQGMAWVMLGLVVGGGYGAYRAKTVEMTKMPELVAFFHSMIGLSAVFIAIAAVVEPWAFQIAAKGAREPTLHIFTQALVLVDVGRSGLKLRGEHRRVPARVGGRDQGRTGTGCARVRPPTYKKGVDPAAPRIMGWQQGHARLWVGPRQQQAGAPQRTRVPLDHAA